MKIVPQNLLSDDTFLKKIKWKNFRMLRHLNLRENISVCQIYFMLLK